MRLALIVSAITLSASCDVLDPVGDYSVDLIGSAFDLAIGEVRPADARVLLNGISIDEKIAFTSSAPGVVTVDPAGVLRAVGQGTATIRASARNQTDSIVVTVGPGVATSVTATPISIAFDALTATQLASVEATNQFGATVPHSAPVQWESLNENVATVTPAGVIKATGAGTTQIIGTSGTHAFEVPVAVNQIVTSLEISGQVPRVFRNERAKINAIARDRLGVAVESSQLAWSSQNEAVATVDQDGWVLGKSSGFTVISVSLVSPTQSAPGSFQSYVSQLAVSAVVPITVENSRLQSVLMNPDSAIVILGESFPAALTVLDNNGAVVSSGYEVDWSSTDQSVAVVNGNGLVTAIGAGTAEIIATVEGLSGIAFVQVLLPLETPNLTLLGVTPTSATLIASPFTAHYDAGHVVSEWQVAPLGTGFSSPVVNIEQTGIALTSYGIGGLSPATMYEARVRFKDNNGNTSKWSEPVSFTTSTTSNSPPSTPVLTSVTAITQTSAGLNGSAFSDPDAASTHQTSQWQVDLSSGSFTNPVVDSGESSTALTSFGVAGLTASTAYKARVRYSDNGGNWSSWSVPVSFTTLAPSNSPPNTPSLTSVTSLAATSATLNGSSFSDPNAGDTHLASQWQVTLSGGSFASPVVDSGENATSLRSYGVTGLAVATGYRARVRYRDNTGGWSSWSTAFSFTTATQVSNSPPNTPSVVSVTSIAQTSAILNGSVFSDPDAGDTHQSSEWQVDLSGGSFASPVVSSGVTGTALRSFGVSGLLASTAYRARVRYRDNQGNWSSWSSAFSFTTAAPVSGDGGGGTSGGSVFQSNWSTLLGTSDSAQGDGGGWNSLLCSPSIRSEVLSVVSGGAHGWTATPNVLQVTNAGSSNCGKVEQRSAIPETANSFYVRVYVRVTGASGNGNTFHSMALNGQGNIQVALWAIAEPSGTTYSPRLILYDHVGVSQHGYGGPALTQGQWYRFEWHVEYYDPANPLRARVWPRIYNMAGALVGDASAYRSYAASRTLAQDYAAGGYVQMASRDLARILAMGYEGNPNNDNLAARWYFAGVEVRTDGFPGPIQ